ncbi:unnamed protein product [Ectocarpus sp. 4 AP-2014]
MRPGPGKRPSLLGDSSNSNQASMTPHVSNPSMMSSRLLTAPARGSTEVAPSSEAKLQYLGSRYPDDGSHKKFTDQRWFSIDSVHSGEKQPPPAAAAASRTSRALLHNKHPPRRQHHHQRRAAAAVASEQVLDAAALQDRLMRSMKLELGGHQSRAVVVLSDRSGGRGLGGGDGGLGGARRDGVRRRCRNQAVETALEAEFGPSEDSPYANPAAAVTGRTVRKSSGDGISSGGGGGGGGGGGRTAAWTCHACSAQNYAVDDDTHPGQGHGIAEEAGQHCSVCVQPRRRWWFPGGEGGDIGDLGSDGRNSCDDGVHEGEEQHQPRRAAMTLAQIRGLEKPPEPKLTPGEWRAVEAKALARGDEAAPCPICRESFRGERQVILSCSHVFHKACLLSFEKFLRAQERSCPLCRKVDYQKKATRQGAAAWRQRCARRLQCAYRRHRARRQYRGLLRRHYGAGLGDTLRRREFLSGQAAETAGKLAAAMEDRGDTIDRLFGEFDRSLAFSRQVFGPTSTSTDPLTATTATGRTDGNNNNNNNGCLSSSSTVGKESKKATPAKERRVMVWKQAWIKAGERAEDECPICMCPMQPIPPSGDHDNGTGTDATSTLLPSGRDVAAPEDIVRAAAVAESPLKTDPPEAGSKYQRGVGKVDVKDAAPVPTGDGERPDVRRAGGSQHVAEEKCGVTPSGSGGAPMSKVGKGGELGEDRPPRAVRKQRERLLLSCSHVFHEACLKAFEGFNIYEVHLCPVCRQEYESADPSRLDFSRSSPPCTVGPGSSRKRAI